MAKKSSDNKENAMNVDSMDLVNVTITHDSSRTLLCSISQNCVLDTSQDTTPQKIRNRTGKKMHKAGIKGTRPGRGRQPKHPISGQKR